VGGMVPWLDYMSVDEEDRYSVPGDRKSVV
jgi:hypothetical protein